MFQIKTKKTKEDIAQNKPKNPLHTNNYYTIKENDRPVHISMQLRMCICRHMIDGHRFIAEKGKAGKCDYPYCICEEFVQGSVEIWDYSENYREINDRKYEGGLF